jgi:hypothetical protein
MTTKKRRLGKSAEEKMLTLRKAGKAFDAIASDLEKDGVKVSPATVRRRVKDKMPTVQEAAQVVAALPDPSAVPPSTPLETINAWVKQAEEQVSVAKQIGDSKMILASMRNLRDWVTLQNRATPAKPENLEERVDYIKLGERALDRFTKMIREIIDAA